MPEIINFRLLARPGNWLKVFLMLFIFSFVVMLVTGGVKKQAPVSAGLSQQPN